MTSTTVANRYTIDAEIAHRHAQIRNEYRRRSDPGRHVSLPKLPAFPKIRFHRPAVTA